MPYARPSLTALRTLALQDISAAQITAGGTTIGGILPGSVLNVLAYVMAGFAFLHYQFLDWISKQSVPYTSTDEYLAGWGAFKGVARKPGTFATGSVTFPAVYPGDIPSGTPVVRGGDGFAYVTTADGPVVSGGTNVTVPIIATTPGAAGNCANAVAMLLGTSVPYIQNTGLTPSPVVGGADQETVDAFRARVMAAFSAPPQGGDMADYIEWAQAVPGVTRAWVAPVAPSAGCVTIYTMFDVSEAAHGGFPQGTNGVATNETRAVAATGDQLTVANAIYPERPVTALVYSNAPTADPVAFTISNLGTNNTTAMQTAITAALADMFVRLANVGGTVNPQNGAAWPALDPSAWYAALSAIPGLSQFTVPTPSGPITPGTGQLFTVGAMAFNP